ncbi:hypothetical protein AVM02_19045 [Brucella anthropi]|uniref:hypothetical protein n=1 Tax=Brucella anthropi TaxID=529 RepID=UPI003987EEBC
MEAKFKTAQPVPADNHSLLMELVSQQTETNRLLRALVEGNQSVTSAVQAVQQALPKPKDERMLSAREAVIFPQKFEAAIDSMETRITPAAP